MFTSNTAEVVDIQKKKVQSDAFTKILHLHKKLKEVAQLESIYKPKYKPAKLPKDQLQKVNSLELALGYKLVVYEADAECDEDKLMILNRVSSLLDEYLSLCKPGMQSQNREEFNDFFQQ